MDNIARLVYLAATHKPSLPKAIAKWVPQGELLRQIITSGIEGATAELNIDKHQLENLFKEGKSGREGSAEEFKVLVVEAAIADLEYRRDDMPMSRWLAEINRVHSYLESENFELVPVEQINLGDIENLDDLPEMPKWKSGFEPLDLVTRGFYQGLITVLGRTGSGKTSIMLTLAEEALKNGVADEVWFYETEIPKDLMLWRMTPIFERLSEKQRASFTLTTGPINILDVINDSAADRNPNRLIFIDSPDVIAAGAGDQRRFSLESIYREMVVLKGMSKAVFAASQVKQKHKSIKINSGAEAWAKAWYSDIMLGVSKIGGLDGGRTKVKANVPKNRFGIADQEITFSYHYGRLVWELMGAAKAAGDWDDIIDDVEQEEMDW